MGSFYSKFCFLPLIMASITSYGGPGLLFNVKMNNANLLVQTTIPHHSYPNAGIKITSPGYKVTSGCTPLGNGYCSFSTSDTTPASLAIEGTQGKLNVILCLNASSALSCQNYTDISMGSEGPATASFAYITNNNASGGDLSPTVSLCFIEAGTQDLINCQNAGGGTLLNSIFSQGIVINSTNTRAYINSEDNSNFNIYQCDINTTTKTFSNCTATLITSPSGYYADYGFLTLNHDNTRLYAVDGLNSRVLMCPIVGGTVQGICNSTNATQLSDSAAGIVLNRAENTAYIANYNGWVTKCKVNPINSTFSACTQFTGGGSITFSRPAGVALNYAETLLYVTDYNQGKIYVCTPTFSTCEIAGSVDGAYGIAVNQKSTAAYVTNYSNTYVCPINPDGKFGVCALKGGFNGPVGVAVGY